MCVFTYKKISCYPFYPSMFILQFSGVRASSRLSCEYVNCIIFQILVVWLFKLWPSFGFFYNVEYVWFVPTYWNVKMKLTTWCVNPRDSHHVSCSGWMYSY